jgi:hypothetical protein
LAQIKHKVNGKSPHHRKTLPSYLTTMDKLMVIDTNVELGTKQEKQEPIGT